MSGLAIIIVVSYLLGSIPFGYLLVKLFRGEDVRKSGSGNIGATNVSRKSPTLGVLTLILDALKGTAAVILAAYLMRSSTTDFHIRIMSLAALCAIAGHLFPVWLKFHGGKGVATGLGSFLAISPKSVLIAAAIFVIVVALFRYISLGSIIAVASFPILAWLLHQYGNDALALLFMSSSALLIIVKHHANIRRLLSGTENRFGASRA